MFATLRPGYKSTRAHEAPQVGPPADSVVEATCSPAGRPPLFHHLTPLSVREYERESDHVKKGGRTTGSKRV